MLTYKNEISNCQTTAFDIGVTSKKRYKENKFV